MAGVKGRSGRKRQSDSTLKLKGTFQGIRHLPKEGPTPEEIKKARLAYKRFLKALKTATAPKGWNPLDAYVKTILDDGRPVGRYHRLACERHRADWARRRTAAFPFDVDFNKIWRFLLFVKRLKHYKGEWAGKPIALQPHQVFRIGSTFGWVHMDTGFRRFRRSYHELPRKNGKTLEAAVVALAAVFFDGEGGAEGYCAATKKDQARLVFNDALKLVESSILQMGLSVYANSIFDQQTSSKLQPLGADADSTDGLNPSCIIIDEFHAHPNRKLIDVLETATGARRQPVDWRITTAGDDPVSPGGDEHEYACNVLDKLISDDTYFAFIAHADPEDDWTKEDTWRKANPNYGVSVLPDDLRSLARKAISMPAAAATFKQKRLNLWVNATAPCLSIDGWRKGQSKWAHEDLEHEPCFVGVDLASKIDLMAMSLVFPPTPGRRKWKLIQYLWTPEDTVIERAHRDRAPYKVWIDQGWLRTTPGTRVNHRVIRETLEQVRTLFDVLMIGYDPWHDDNLVNDLVTLDGFAEDAVIEIPQTFAGMSSACLNMQAEILDGQVDARGCPVTAWAVSNAVGDRDGKDNLMFVKKKSRGRIDPLIAATIGMALKLRQPVQKPKEYQVQVFG